MRLSIVLVLLLLATIVAGGPWRPGGRPWRKGNIKKGQRVVVKVLAARSPICKVMIGEVVKKEKQCTDDMECLLEKSLCKRNKKVYVCRKPVSSSTTDDTKTKKNWILKKIKQKVKPGKGRKIAKTIIRKMNGKQRQKKVFIVKKGSAQKRTWKNKWLSKYRRTNRKRCKTTTPSMKATADSKSATVTTIATDATEAKTTVATTRTTSTATATPKATEATPVVTTEDVDVNNKFKNE